VDEVIKGDCLRWILVSFFGLACGSPPNDKIEMSSAAHRTGHWIVHGASFGACVSDRLASTAPRYLASLLQKVQPPDTWRPSCRKYSPQIPGVPLAESELCSRRNLALVRALASMTAPTQQLSRSFQNEVLRIYTSEEGKGS
jgi:hypothetical protein